MEIYYHIFRINFPISSFSYHDLFL